MMKSTQLMSIDDIASIDGVISASLITRGGEYLEGTIPPDTRRDTFSAMSAIILGAAERSAIELNDSLLKVSVGFDSSLLMIFGLDSQCLMAVIGPPEADIDKIIETTRVWKGNGIKH